VKLLAFTLMTLSLVLTIAVIAQTPQSKSSVAVAVPEQTGNAMQVMRDGSQQSTEGAAANFTGSVQVKPLFSAHNPSRVAAAQVTFDPGSRSAWHTHPLDSAGIKALARSNNEHQHDAYRGSGRVKWQECGMDGKGQRRAIPR
jgi:hypothetical protein